MKRRDFIKNSSLAAAAGLSISSNANRSTSAQEPLFDAQSGMPIAQQSISQWCYGYMSLPELLPQLKELGLSAIDLIKPSDWPLLKEHGFTCSMAYGREKEDITTGFIDEHLHDELYSAYAKTIPLMADYGWKNLVCFAGNRRGRYDYEGMRIAAKGLKRLMPIAEEHGVILQMELFNSKVNHPDYMGDSTAWMVTLCDMVGSDSFKILYDIYHMQVQEGNVIQTILDYHDYFGHYHTAGVPGRNELNSNQELNYPAIMKAIKSTGFEGFVAHEFIPTYENKLDGLAEAIKVCS